MACLTKHTLLDIFQHRPTGWRVLLQAHAGAGLRLLHDPQPAPRRRLGHLVRRRLLQGRLLLRLPTHRDDHLASPRIP